ncbi:MAG TPA: glycosyltransferase family 4 protein [Flavobacteriaceae bacterium]|nr:glycosyltransferase family 4 protein [Flavobacteriaceae bacterium]
MTGKKLHICLVGGEDVHKRIELSQYLVDAGFRVTILGTSSQKFPDYVEYVNYNLVRSFSPVSDYKTVIWLKNYFKENNFDLIHTYDTKPAFLVPIALKKTKTPITRTITGLGTVFMAEGAFYTALRKLYFKLHRYAKKRVSNTVFQNIEDRDIYLKNKLVEHDKTSLILSSGIELKHINKLAKRDQDPFTFICVARLVYEKGIINYLEAARLCRDKGYTFKCLLVGPLEENSKRLNKTILKDYDDVVTRLGQRNDVMQLLLDSHACVLPTFREGFPRVLLEAAAVGLPIVSTEVPGVKEFLKNEEDALLVEVQNSEALANAMIRIFDDNNLAEKLAQNALKNVEQYSLENVANQYITIFTKTINAS